MYADDTNLTCASKDPDELFSFLTHHLGNLVTMLVHWDLAQSLATINFSSNSDTCLDGHSIERIDSYHGLGVQVNEALSWDPLISEVKQKVSKVLAALSRL